MQESIFSDSTGRSDDESINPSFWLDEKEEQFRKQDILNRAMIELTNGNFTPIVSTLNTPLSDLGKRQRSYYIAKGTELIKESLAVLVPGQENELLNEIHAKVRLPTTVCRTPQQDTMVMSLIAAYEEASGWQTKKQILSLFCNDFTKDELIVMVPGLSKWKIDQARLHTTQVGAGMPAEEKTIHRTRLQPAQTDHFHDFISQPAYLQGVAFGTRTLKLEDGSKIVIPAAIRTVIPSRIIS